MAIVSGQTDHNHLIHHEAVTAYVLSLAFWAQKRQVAFWTNRIVAPAGQWWFFQRQDVALRNRALNFLQRVRKYSPPKKMQNLSISPPLVRHVSRDGVQPLETGQKLSFRSRNLEE